MTTNLKGKTMWNQLYHCGVCNKETNWVMYGTGGQCLRCETKLTW